MKRICLLILVIGFHPILFSQDKSEIKLKDLKNIEEIYFHNNTQNFKKIVKRWRQYSDIYKVTVDSKVDSVFLMDILTAVSANKNIEELTVSLSNSQSNILSMFDLSHIKKLRISHSKNINQSVFAQNKALLNQLQAFSWVNNQQPLSSTIFQELKQLKNIELIDTQINFINNSLTQNLSKLAFLNTVSVSYINEGNLADISQIKSLQSITLVNIERYKPNVNFFELQNEFETNNHALIDHKTSFKILYANNDETCSENEKNKVINQFGFSDFVQQSKVIENQRIESKNTIKNRESNSPTSVPYKDAFKRPIESLKIDPQSLSINGFKDTVLKFENGTTISIPNQCFVNSKGESVENGITLVYREMNNPISIFASGIPMTTTIDGKKETLTSGGMFEIRAFSGQEELQVKEGKKIEIELASIDDNKPYNFYEFDTNDNEWKDLKKDIIPTPLDTQIVEWNRGANIQLVNSVYTYVSPNLFDTSSFESRFNDLDYFYLCDKEFVKKRVSYQNGLYKDNKKIKNHGIYNTAFVRKKNLVKFVSIPREKRDSFTALRMQFNTPLMQLYFPELIHFNNITFYNNEFSKYRKFKEHYFKNKMYSDLKIEYTKGDDFCVVLLKEKREIVRLILYFYDEDVVKESKKNIYKKNFYRAYSKYNKKRNERAYSFNSLLRFDYLMSLRGSSKTRLDTLNDSIVNKTVMWLKPVNAKRRIELIKTGLYNVDVKYEYVQSKVYELTLYDNDNNPLVFETIYVFDENANTYFKFDNQKVVLQPESLMGIIATTVSGAIYYINKNDIPNIDFNADKVPVKMNKNNTLINSLEKAIKLFISKKMD